MNKINKYMAATKIMVDSFYKLSEDVFRGSYTYKDYILAVTSRKNRNKKKRKK